MSNEGIILQGDYVKIIDKKDYYDLFGIIVGYDPIYEEYKIRLVKNNKTISCEKKTYCKSL